MPELATTTTLDIITRAAYKYRLVTRGSTDLLGAELLRLNMLAVEHADRECVTPTLVEYTRQTFPRKVKRTAIDGALRFWLEQVADLPGIAECPAYQIVVKAKDKNDDRLGLVTFDYGEDVYDEDGDWVSEGEVTRLVASPPLHSFWNVSNDDRDSVMIRPREEREAEQRAIMEQRMAERAAILAEREAERAVATASVAEQLAEDYDDEDDWEDEDDDA